MKIFQEPAKSETDRDAGGQGGLPQPGEGPHEGREQRVVVDERREAGWVWQVSRLIGDLFGYVYVGFVVAVVIVRS